LLKILFVTSGQPAANPRLVKEIRIFAQKGYKVSVVYCPISPWANKFDKDIISENKDIQWIRVGKNNEENRFSFLLVRLRKKAWTITYKYFGDIFDAALKSSVLFSQELIISARKIKADLYIGHNLGALPAVIIASKRFNARACFDFEDFHRGESNTKDYQSCKVKCIEDKYVPLLDLATCASPLIEVEYKKLYPKLKITTINNCFPLKYRSNISNIQSNVDELRLFWFSQYIGKERGLEDIIQAIGLVKEKRIKLTLLGNITPTLKTYFNNISSESNLNKDQLVFIEPVPENELVGIGQQHHIGIASEVPIHENRNYCLTNKIFIYLLSKNAIIFSNTKAQSEFLNQHPGIGFLYNQGDIQQIATYLRVYSNDISELKRQQNNSDQLGQLLNWENESAKLLQFYSLT